jgi:phage recombination protein Bet
MTGQVQNTQNQVISFEVNGETIKLSPQIVRQYIAKNQQVTDDEVMYFMALAKSQKLNPFTNDVYLVKFNNSPAQIIVSKKAFMEKAEANEHYKGFEAGIVVMRDGQLVEQKGSLTLPNDELIGGWCRIFRDDRDVPVEAIVSIKEYGKGQSTWKSMPATMIRKVAIVNAIREAFPSLGNLYDKDELPSPKHEINGVVEPSKEEIETFDKQAYFEQKKAEMETVDMTTGEIATQETLEGVAW